MIYRGPRDGMSTEKTNEQTEGKVKGRINSQNFVGKQRKDHKIVVKERVDRRQVMDQSLVCQNHHQQQQQQLYHLLS